VKRRGRDNIVYVEIEDGFEIPVMAGDLIKVDVSDTVSALFAEEQHETAASSVAEEDDPRFSSIRIKGKEAGNSLMLAFLPSDQKWLITGDVEIHLLNDSDFELIYQLWLKDSGKYNAFDFGNIPPRSRMMIGTSNREQLSYYLEGVIQFMLHKNTVDEIPRTGEQSFKIKAIRLMKEDNYAESQWLTSKAYIHRIAVISNGREEIPQENLKQEQLREQPLILEYIKEDGVAEVDLHFESIAEHAGNTPHHMKMEYQLSFFRKILESAISENIRKLVFIHGVGAGVLKLELIKILSEYSFIEHQDASIARYGIGATEVLIRHNKNTY
jgi:hypothetical protein